MLAANSHQFKPVLLLLKKKKKNVCYIFFGVVQAEYIFLSCFVSSKRPAYCYFSKCLVFYCRYKFSVYNYDMSNAMVDQVDGEPVHF